MTVYPLAAVVYARDEPLEEILADARDRLVALPGVRVGGLVPCYGPRHSNGRLSLWLADISGKEPIALSQDLGPGSQACILDTNGLTSARLRLAEAIALQPDLVFFGRFAKEEIAGRGIREEIGLAVAQGIAALVAVDETMLSGWEMFAGDEWTRLPADAGAIVEWFMSGR